MYHHSSSFLQPESTPHTLHFVDPDLDIRAFPYSHPDIVIRKPIDGNAFNTTPFSFACDGTIPWLYKYTLFTHNNTTSIHKNILSIGDINTPILP